MVRIRRIAIPVLGVCLLLVAQPVGVEPCAAEETGGPDGPSPAVGALRSAASATASDVTSRAAELPGRTRLGGERLVAAAAEGLARLLPDALLDRVGRARARAQRWHSAAGASVHAAAALRERIARAGGVVAAADRALDTVAALALLAVLLRWRADARRRRHSGAPTRETPRLLRGRAALR